MSEFILDLTNYRDTQGARVEPGDYEVVVEHAELGKSKAGNQMVTLSYRIIGTEFDGLTIVDRLTLSDKALFRVVGFMQAIGMPTPKKKFKLNTARFLNKRLSVTVDDGDPYNGSVKSEVRGYMRASSAAAGGGGTSADADEDALFDDEAEDLTEDEAVEQPAPRKQQAAPAEDDEDDQDELDLDEVDLDDLDV